MPYYQPLYQLIDFHLGVCEPLNSPVCLVRNAAELDGWPTCSNVQSEVICDEVNDPGKYISVMN